MEYISLKKPSGTFAWFTATTRATVNAASDDDSRTVSVEEIKYGAGTVAVDGLDVAVSAPALSGTKLELAHVPGSSVPNYSIRNAPGLSTAWLGNEATPVVHELGFIDEDGDGVKDDASEDGNPVLANSSNCLYGSVTITLTTVEDTDDYGYVHSADSIADDLDGEWTKVTISSSSHIRLFESTASNLTTSSNSCTSLTWKVHFDKTTLKGSGHTKTVYFFVLGDSVTAAGDVGGITASATASQHNEPA